MTEITEQIEAIAKHSYESNRNATNNIEWKDVSRNTRESHINEARDQRGYISEMLTVLGASPQKVERLTDSLAINVEHSAKLMMENAELQSKLTTRNEDIRDLKEKQKSYMEHMGKSLDDSDAFKDLQKKFNLLHDSFDIISDEATASADMLEKLIPLQRENEVLKEERDALEAALNAITSKQTAISNADKETVLAFLKLHGVKAGKQLISAALGESSVVQAKASKDDWVSIYTKKHGVDALLKACEC